MTGGMGSTFGSSCVLAGLLMLVRCGAPLSAQAKPKSRPCAQVNSAAAVDAGAAPESTAPVSPAAGAEVPPAPALQPSAAAPALRAASPAQDAATSAEAAASYRAANSQASLEESGPPRSYAWQLLLVDVAGLLAGVGVAASVDSEASQFGMVAATWYGVGLIGAPAVHYGNGKWPLGMASFGFRALVPPLIGVSGLVSACLTRTTQLGLFEPAGPRHAVRPRGRCCVRRARARARHTTAPLERSWYGLQTLALDAIGYGIGAFLTMREPREGEQAAPRALAVGHELRVATIGCARALRAWQRRDRLRIAGMRLISGPMGAVFGVMGACAATAGEDDCAEHGAQLGLLAAAWSSPCSMRWCSRRAGEHASLDLGVSLGGLDRSQRQLLKWAIRHGALNRQRARPRRSHVFATDSVSLGSGMAVRLGALLLIWSARCRLRCYSALAPAEAAHVCDVCGPLHRPKWARFRSQWSPPLTQQLSNELPTQT